MHRTAYLGILVLASSAALSACGSSTQVSDPAADGDASARQEYGELGADLVTPEVEPNGTVIEIQMFTRDPDSDAGEQVFRPKLVTAQVGDTIRFVPTDPTHQSSSVASMLPEGASGWEGRINQSVSYVLPKAGVYGYQCVPHYSAGMVGLIIVEGEGKLDNLGSAQAVEHPGLAGPQFEELFAQAEAEGLFN